MPSKECRLAMGIARRLPSYKRMEEHLTRVAVAMFGSMQPRLKEMINGVADSICKLRGMARPGRLERRQKRAMIAWYCVNIPQLLNVPVRVVVEMVKAIGFVMPPAPIVGQRRDTRMGDGSAVDGAPSCLEAGDCLELLCSTGFTAGSVDVRDPMPMELRLSDHKLGSESCPFGGNSWFL
jgi:hypothetical protein